MMAKQCSFCEALATETVVDDDDFFPCCAKCRVAWNGNPGFIRPDPLALAAHPSTKGAESHE
jgi:hypothetical protein